MYIFEELKVKCRFATAQRAGAPNPMLFKGPLYIYLSATFSRNYCERNNYNYNDHENNHCHSRMFFTLCPQKPYWKALFLLP